MDFQNLKQEEKKSAFLELMTQPVGQARQKAITTIMERKGLSFENAKKYQAMKILGITEEELKELPRPSANLSSLGSQI